MVLAQAANQISSPFLFTCDTAHTPYCTHATRAYKHAMGVLLEATNKLDATRRRRVEGGVRPMGAWRVLRRSRIKLCRQHQLAAHYCIAYAHKPPKARYAHVVSCGVHPNCIRIWVQKGAFSFCRRAAAHANERVLVLMFACGRWL